MQPPQMPPQASSTTPPPPRDPIRAVGHARPAARRYHERVSDLPVMLHVRGKRCVVVGGGPTAVREARTLGYSGVTGDGRYAEVLDHAGLHRAIFVVVTLPGAESTLAADDNIMPGRTYRYRVFAVFPTPNGPRGSSTSNTITVRVPEQ